MSPEQVSLLRRWSVWLAARFGPEPPDAEQDKALEAWRRGEEPPAPPPRAVSTEPLDLPFHLYERQRQAGLRPDTPIHFREYDRQRKAGQRPKKRGR